MLRKAMQIPLKISLMNWIKLKGCFVPQIICSVLSESEAITGDMSISNMYLLSVKYIKKKIIFNPMRRKMCKKLAQVEAVSLSPAAIGRSKIQVSRELDNEVANENPPTIIKIEITSG